MSEFDVKYDGEYEDEYILKEVLCRYDTMFKSKKELFDACLTYSVYTYMEYCKWISDELLKYSLNVPGYETDDKPFGCDSYGGTDPKPHSEMCKKGYLTTSSQDGFCDEHEVQFSYVLFVIPLMNSREFISKLTQLVKDEIINVYHLNQCCVLDVSKESCWKPFRDTIPLTIIDGKIFTSLQPDCYSEGIQMYGCIMYWCYNGYKFSSELCENLRKNKLQTFACVMRHSGAPIMQYILPLF